MITIDAQLRSITGNALRRSVLLFAVFAVPTVLASILRAIEGDWQPTFTLQLTLLGLLLICAGLRNRLPLMPLGGLMIGICVAAGWAGMYTYGMLAPAGHWLLAIAVFMIGMLYSERGMVFATLSVLGGMLIIAWLYINGHASPAVTPAEFLATPGSWLVELMCAILFIAIVVPTLRQFVDAMETLMSEFELRRDKIAYLAEHDELTGLPLLRVARDRLAMACNRSRRSGNMAAVLFIDLDGFKQVNDRYGHEAGDTCLRAVAARLNERLRDQDTAARIGGDEFIVVLDNISGETAAAQLATELISLIKKKIDFDGHSLQIGASIGVALSPENGRNAPILLRNADQAMYRSKRAGSNGFAFAEADTSTVDTDELRGFEEETQALSNADTAGHQRHSLGDQLLEAIVNRCIVVLAGVILITVLANVWRIAVNQVAPNIAPTLFALVLVMVLFFGRKRVSLRYKMALTSGIGLLIALPGLYNSGLAGPAIGWGLAVTLFLVGIFYNRHICLAIAIIVPAAILLSGLGFLSETLAYSFDVNQEALHPAKWLVFLLAAMAYNGMVLSAWSLHKKTSSRLMAETTAQIAELVRLATIDELTGLPLLRLATDRLEMACSRAQRANGRAAVMLIDLDGFKAVNDSLGHEAGDHCLCEVARRMSAQLRSTDTTARIGGDEFLVVLDSISEREEVEHAARRLIEVIARTIEFDKHRFNVSASIGIAIFPEHGESGESLRQRADAAMYVAKRAGKNRFEFSAAT